MNLWLYLCINLIDVKCIKCMILMYEIAYSHMVVIPHVFILCLLVKIFFFNIQEVQWY